MTIFSKTNSELTTDGQKNLLQQNFSNQLSQDLTLSSYDYELPKNLIADRPNPNRDQCKLLVYHQASDKIEHLNFCDVINYLDEEDLLVLNSSKVFPARLKVIRPTGGKAEIFLTSLNKKIIGEKELFKCLIKSNAKKRSGDIFLSSADNQIQITIENRLEDGLFEVSFNTKNVVQFLSEVGQVPIPPYIRNGESDQQDKRDYQTVYADQIGSVAAPTAGLHFTDDLLEKIQSKLDIARVNLHVGPGTFYPIKNENILDHHMHTETYSVSSSNQIKIQKRKNSIIAVGTTSLRTLASCYDYDKNRFSFVEDEHLTSETDIFLHPGKKVFPLKGIITNFHLPKSSLLVLVSSLIGRKKALELYEEAIKNEYLFYSYGDAMLLLLDHKKDSE
jgi:S-adenosylmethionine:tRNA ribosyltransferase-isomerase